MEITSTLNDVTYWLEDYNECITVDRLTTKISNILCGDVERHTYGTMTVTNHTTGEKCVVEKMGLGEIKGVVFDKEGKEGLQLYGSIYDAISMKKIFEEEIWRMKPLVRNCN